MESLRKFPQVQQVRAGLRVKLLSCWPPKPVLLASVQLLNFPDASASMI